ncbi:MAG TPA: TraB/GumN family protein [Steroidobacteraceae bacterium]|nr:TraB/GumN family protein [Steroidobacteraceae bacterium]
MGRSAFWGLLALGLLGGLSAAAAPAASPVWVIRGAHSTLYLAGSVHLLPAQDAALPPGFERAYTNSARLVMELDLAKLDPLAAASWMLEHGALPPGSSLRDILGEQRYARVSASAAQLGLPAEVLAGQAPWVIALELADLDYVQLGMDPQQGVEEQLVHRAQADGKPTAGLETLDEELGGLEALSREDQLRLLDQTLSELQEGPEQLHQVLAAWRHGNAARLAALLAREYRSFPALYRPLVTARNQRWLAQIEQLATGQENCLVVVGALHLVGDGGLLELLRKDGFTPVQLN